uniref:Uncharacterized protein n=1 Tax=Anguilla anguilla TaxID=7936 RepID=A0A0E9SNG6_ANGAN
MLPAPTSKNRWSLRSVRFGFCLVGLIDSAI